MSDQQTVSGAVAEVAAPHGECTAEFHVDNPLVCMLAEGHHGLHWDGCDNILWKVGKPDE